MTDFKPKHKGLLLENINVGEVTRAAWPLYVGNTPDYNKSPKIKFRNAMLEKNIKANERAKSLLHSQEWKLPEQKVYDNRNDRRIQPNEYRGANISNCMYDT